MNLSSYLIFFTYKLLLLLLLLLSGTNGGTTTTAGSGTLHCFQCGQYNEGVGSITPCINGTYMKLKECPRRATNYCLKYISEGTVVRDCVPKCTEKDNWDWNSRTFCCQENGCNSSNRNEIEIGSSFLLLLFPHFFPQFY